MKKVIETKEICRLLDHVDDQTLVLLDIDNTLIEPRSFAGSVAWFEYIAKKMEKTGMSQKEIIKKVYTVWSQYQEAVQVKTVEDATVETVDALHNQDIKTMGLTGRGFRLHEITQKQLNSVGISLEKNTIHHDKIVFSGDNGFYSGVLSVEAFGNKGGYLMKMLEQVAYKPEKIVFVDDDERYIKRFCEVVDKHEIPYTCLRYGGADDQYDRFDPQKAYQELLQMFKGTEHEDFVSSMM